MFIIKWGRKIPLFMKMLRMGMIIKKGNTVFRNFKLTGKENELIIQQFKDGNFITTYETFKLNLWGFPLKSKRLK